MASPVSFIHAKPDSLIQTWLGVYAARAMDGEVLTNATVKLDAEDVVQPDALLRLLPAKGGRTEITPDNLLAGPPELIVEIAASSVSLDAGQKRRSYLRAGVREYLLWRVEDNAFDWWVWESYDYRVNAPDAQGVIRSPHFSGLWLNVPSLLNHDAASILATLDEGLKSRA